ncbi:hypothetical protein [Streptomyces zingiberis]|uniref:Uncharacterized protein n=1 Tax=Streptomyces zingiberis TaxID=2053010 RepID=A0ABX1C3C2_9ACTN|nr:hypothetical protein [Streptomyces zingiberis]NJQ03281.1 hypothetical protein [Streptomyces zingiberis]
MVGELVGAALAFPSVPFTSALLVSTAFWLLVLCGVTAYDTFDGDVDAAALRLGGVPVALSLSLLTLVGWGADLAGTVALRRAALGGLAHGLAAIGLFAAALLLAWGATVLLVRPLRRLFPGGGEGPGGPAREGERGPEGERAPSAAPGRTGAGRAAEAAASP